MSQILKLFLVIILLIPSLAFASEIVLKSGQKLEGKIIEQTDKYIKFDSGLGVVITYYTDEIEAVDGQKIKSPVPPPPLSQANNPTKKDLNQNTTQSDNKEIFENRLSKYLNDLKAITQNFPLTSQEILNTTKSANDLNNFADEYPNSEYAYDAQYVVVWTQSTAIINLEKWEQLFNRFPNGKLKDSTIENLKNAIPHVRQPLTLSELHLPDSALSLNIKSMYAIEHQNYNDVVKYCLDLLKNIDRNNADFKEVVAFTYVELLVSYKYLNNKTDYDRIKQEAITFFPERKYKYDQIWQ